MELPEIPYRNVVPAGYVLATFALEGRSPLLMKSSHFDPDGELYRAYYTLGQKRGKSIDDNRRLREVEWQLSLYLDEQVGPYIPAENVKELIRSAATKWRKGEEIKRSLVVIEQRIPLLYEGPRDQDGIQEGVPQPDGTVKKFHYDCLVANSGTSGGRVWRRRPRFWPWALVADLAYDPEDLDFDLLEVIIERTRKYGLGDGRAIGFGSFVGQITKGEVFKGEADGDATKLIDVSHLMAHVASRDRVMTATTSRRSRAKMKA